MSSPYNGDAEAPSAAPRGRADENTSSVTKEDSSNKGAVLIVLAILAFLLGGGIVAGVWGIMESQKDSTTSAIAISAPTPSSPTASPVQNPTLSFTSKPTSRPGSPTTPGPTPGPTQPPTGSQPVSIEDRLMNAHDPIVQSAFEWLSVVDNYQPVDYAEYEERYALAAFFFQTGGNSWWKFKTGWLTSTTACGWYGVTCDSAGKVAGIELNENSLVGTIPSELGILSALTSVTIFNSFELTGSLPTQLSRLTDLKRITMRSNYLSGTIPTQISTLRSLTTLDLENNILSGSIPTTLTVLVNLQQLSIGGNELKGSIPAGIVDLTDLRTLELDRNQLGGSVADLSSLRFLEKLDLKTNKFTGSVPVLPSSLQVCDLEWNDWSDTENGLTKGCFTSNRRSNVRE